MVRRRLSGTTKILLFAHFAIAPLVGIQIHRDNGTIAGGAVETILEGAFWPITLIVEAIREG